MSLFRPAISAPRLPTNATSAPSTAIQDAMLAPEPPPCMVTVAAVSLPLTKGNAARATASVMRSPTTTTRVIVVTTSSRARTANGPAGPRASGSSGTAREHRYPWASTPRLARFSCSVEKTNSFRSSWQREQPARYHKKGFFGLAGQQLIKAAEFVSKDTPAACIRDNARSRLLAYRDDMTARVAPGGDQFIDAVGQAARDQEVAGQGAARQRLTGRGAAGQRAGCQGAAGQRAGCQGAAGQRAGCQGAAGQRSSGREAPGAT